jgi:IMP dehydrogenase
MVEKKVEKIPLVDSENNLYGLITLKDIELLSSSPLANLDPSGRLYVGAAVGGRDDYLERSACLVDSGVDVLVVDVANGHN